MFESDKPNNDSYQHHAENAAELERKGDYIKAAFAWTVAALKAKHPENNAWALARTDFCNKRPKICKEAEAA